MHATGLLLAPLAALALGARGASVHRPRQSDPHVVDFRTFGLPGCDEQNQGVYTYLQSDLGTCFPFSTTDVVESIFVTDINAGCSVYAYTDANCTQNQVTVPVGIENCYDYSAGLFSYKTVCS